MDDVIVIGGGPAGMIAAIIAARNNKKVILVEKNDKLGKKLFITGKGRCNITNACDVEELLSNTITNNKFLYSSFYTFNSDSLIDFLNDLGLKTKIERGNRVFPISDKSSDVIKVLSNELKRLDVDIKLNTNVIKLQLKNDEIEIITSTNNILSSKKVIVATGGISYSMTGSTGDGYNWGKKLGHKVTKLAPGLVPIETKESFVHEMQGLSLKNVKVKFVEDGKVLYENFGEMLFTHYGLSGPIILSASSYLPKQDISGIKIVIDLKPSLNYEQLDARILRDFNKYSRKNFSNALNDLLPKKLIPIIIKLSKIDEYKRVDQITKTERKTLVDLIKGLTMTIKGTRKYNEAIITRGGISIKDINPNTMESKIVKGLYFAGEVLDLDALTGGFNLQIAFSTGYLAGYSV